MIEVEGLTKRFGEVNALSDVSFKVDKGQIVGFLGANGAGKTTTMDIICGCIGADNGEARVAGFDITTDPIEAKKRLGYLPDVPPLHPEMRVRDYVSYAARLNGLAKSQIDDRVDKTLDRLSVREVQHRLVGNLSKGYRQRVALAQAIVHDPEVLVLDEPTEGLDPNQIIHIRELIKSLAGEHTIILSSHILSEVQNTCDYLIIIHEGRVVQQGSYGSLVAEMEAGSVYDLKVGQNAERLVTELAAIGGVIDPCVASPGDEIRFALSKEASSDAIDRVARQVLDGGYGLREITRKTRSLEEVFLQLTQ